MKRYANLKISIFLGLIEKRVEAYFRIASKYKYFFKKYVSLFDVAFDAQSIYCYNYQMSRRDKYSSLRSLSNAFRVWIFLTIQTAHPY